MVRYVVPVLGAQRLTQLTPVEVQALYGKLQERGLSARTVRYCHTVFSNALGQAVKWRLSAQNPAQYVDLPKQQKQEMRTLSETDAAHFLRVASGSKHHALFATLLGTGLRPGEAFALQWPDLDEARNTLRVQRTVTVSRSGWTFAPPKTARGRRHLALPPGLTRLLLEHRREQTVPNPHNLVFPSDTGTPLNLRNVTQRYFKAVLKAAGLPAELRLYDLRHTHATLLLSQNEHPKIVSERLGHATVTLTLDTYSHVLPGMQSASALKLDAVLFGAEPGGEAASRYN